MGVCVPDASVILKWVLPPENESYAEAAEIMRDGLVTGEIDLLVPTLWLFEVGNTLTRKYPRQAEALLATLISLQLPEAHLNPEWQSRMWPKNSRGRLIQKFQQTEHPSFAHLDT